MTELLTIGEPLVCLASKQLDVSLEKVTSFKKYIGGAELNVVTGMSRLNHRSLYIAQVGDDPFGKIVLDYLKNLDVDMSCIKVQKGYWTGHQIKELVSNGDPLVFNYRSDSATSHFDSQIISDIKNAEFKIAHLTGIFPSLSCQTREAFDKLYFKLLQDNKPISFDTNLRPSLWSDKEEMCRVINEYARKATIILPGVNEGKILMGSDKPEEIADYYLQGSRSRLVVVKLGASGAYVKEKGQEGYYVSGFKVTNIKDTVGAGDGFTVGLLSGLLENLSVKKAVCRANAIGAMQIQVYGDNDGYPTSKQLKDFYRNQKIFE